MFSTLLRVRIACHSCQSACAIQQSGYPSRSGSGSSALISITSDVASSARQSRQKKRLGTTNAERRSLRPRLIRLVAGSQRPDQWLNTGRADAAGIRELLSRNGYPLERMSSILDFGCGCGRVARWWSGSARPRVFGCDYDGRLTQWCKVNLPFMKVKINGSRPPLPFKSDTFDLVYAISLFTHLTASAQSQWLEDITRVLKPGGLLLFTVHGERFAHLLTDQRHAFERGEMVVLAPELVGQEGCAAFHPASYVLQTMLPASGLELVDTIDDDGSGQPVDSKPTTALQDNYLVRKPPSYAAAPAPSESGP